MKNSFLIIGLIALLLVTSDLKLSAADVFISDSSPTENKDSLVIQSTKSNKTVTVYNGQKIKLRCLNGDKIKGKFISSDGDMIKIQTADKISSVNTSTVKSYYIFKKMK